LAASFNAATGVGNLIVTNQTIFKEYAIRWKSYENAFKYFKNVLFEAKGLEETQSYLIF
jgi:hypothetical protein